ncbi:hypothetical protein SNEBB_002505 [Seison nebaliae]|nr:hypothetical protein SNEBB_002505 [Seison nebaliae]
MLKAIEDLPEVAALYVSNLSDYVKEPELRRIFDKQGQPESVLLCRDSAGKSLGYGYVNYLSESQASEAMRYLNFTVHYEKELRIILSPLDQQICKNEVGNLIIRNLPKTVTNIQLYHTFFKFGTILSCGIVMDENNESLGYGYVHYKMEEDANKVIETVNGKTIMNYILEISKSVPKEKKKPIENHVNMVYVKNFNDACNNESLAKLFSKVGPVKRAKVITDDEGRSKGFGFVCFEKSESAEQAVDQMNKFILEVERPNRVPKVVRYKLFVRKAVKKKHEQSNGNEITLLVKNINAQATQKEVEDYFSQIGKLSSVNFQRDPLYLNRVNGFIVYEKQENAIDAMKQLSGTILGGCKISIVVQKSDEINELTPSQQMIYGGPPYYTNRCHFISENPNNRMQSTVFVPTTNYQFANIRSQCGILRPVPSMRNGMTNQPNSARINVQPTIHDFLANSLNEQVRGRTNQINHQVTNYMGPICQQTTIQRNNTHPGEPRTLFFDKLK